MAKVEALRDKFNDNSLDTGLWTTSTSGISSGVSETGQRLVLQSDNSSGNFAAVISATTYDLTSSEMYVEVVDAGGSTYACALRFDVGSNNFIEITTVADNLRFDVVTGGSRSNKWITTYSSSTHRWWKIAHDGTNVIASTSANGTTWTQRWSGSVGYSLTAGTAQMRLARNSTSTFPDTATFDSFNGAFDTYERGLNPSATIGITDARLVAADAVLSLTERAITPTAILQATTERSTAPDVTLLRGTNEPQAGGDVHPTFHLSLYTHPGGRRLADLDLNPRVTALRWTTQIESGFGVLDVGLDPPERRGYYEFSRGWLPDPLDAPAFAHVVLRAGGFVLFEGRLMRRVRLGGYVRGFSAVGYASTALSDDVYTGASTSDITTGTLLRDVLATAAPLIVPHDEYFLDPLTVHKPAEFTYLTPGEIVDQLSKEGSDEGLLWDLQVWDGQKAHFLPRLSPDAPTYRVPFDERIEWHEDFEDVYGAVAVEYGAARSLTSVLVHDDFYDRYGLNRLFIVRGGDISPTNALALGRVWLVEHVKPLTSCSIRLENHAGLERASGVQTPGYLARSGEWIKVGDERMLPIVSTNYDGLTGDSTLELGHPSVTSLSSFLASQRSILARLARGINPVTGGRTV